MSLTLTTGNTLKGKAGTATAVTYTILGDRITTTDSFEVIGQGQLPTSTGDLLTTTPVAASTNLIINEILLTNTTASPVTGIVLYINGTAASNQLVQLSLVANGSASYSGGKWTTYDSGGGILGGSGIVTSVTAADSSLIITPTTGGVTASRAAFTGDTTASAGSNVTKVVAIQNAAVDSTPPTNGQVLQYVSASTKYIPFSYAGDVGGGPSASIVQAIQGKAVSATTPTTSQILQYNSSNTWVPTTREFNVVSYGADPTGSSNSATAIQNAVNAAQLAAYSSGSGAVVWFPPGRYLIGSTINVTGHNITLLGAGGGQSADFGNYATPMASHLVPQSAIVAVKVTPVTTNGLSGVPNYGFKWRGLGVDCYANAGTIGLQMFSTSNFEIDDFYCINATDCALDLNCLQATLTNGTVGPWPIAATTITVLSTAASGSSPAFPSSGSFIMKDGAGVQRIVTYTGTSGTTFTGCSSGGLGSGTTATTATVSILPGAQDNTRGRVGIFNVRAIDSGGASGIAIRMNGDTSGVANTNLINFVGPVKVAHLNGIAIKDINSDTNYFDFLVINRAGGGTGLGAEIGAGTTAALASRNNVFNHASFGAGGLTLRGTPTATFASGPTYVKSYQLANGEAAATTETGAYQEIQYNGAVMLPGLKNVSNVATTYTAATLTQIPGSLITIPQQGIQVGTTFRWHVPISKTAPGTVGSIVSIRIGTLGTTADPIVQTWAAGTGTAAADAGYYDINYTITTTGASATGTAAMQLIHSLNITGLDNTAGGNPTRIGTPSTFNSASATSLFVSLSITTGATVVLTSAGTEAWVAKINS